MEVEKVSRSRDYIGDVPVEVAERIMEARKKIIEGSSINLEELIKKLGCARS
jgi:hypothetical protein